MDKELREAFREVKGVISTGHQEVTQKLTEIQNDQTALWKVHTEVKTRLNGHLDSHAINRKWWIMVCGALTGGLVGIALKVFGA